MKFAALVLSNLRRKRLRTALTLLSITVAFILFGYLAAIRVGLGAGVQVAGADRLFVRHRVSIAQPLPISYLDRIKRVPGVRAAIHQSWFGGIYQEAKNFFPQMAVDPEPFLDMYPEFILPEEQKLAWLRTRNGAIVGRSTASRFGFKIGDHIPLQATIWRREDGGVMWDFEIVGIYDGADRGTDTSQFFFWYDYLEEGRAFGKGLVGWYVVKVDNPEQAAEVSKLIDDEFVNSSDEVKAETERAFISGWVNQIGDIGLIIRAILTAVFFTILLVAGNTIAQSVRERTQELGVLKALGFTNRQVLCLVFAESCMISCLGGFLGLGIALLLISAGDPTGGALPVFYVPVRDVVYGACISVGLGLVTGFFPALRAMRLEIAESLRQA